jgi:ABC-type bacteriocin/lantibiotic exporter with double-glycine peptidase domain
MPFSTQYLVDKVLIPRNLDALKTFIIVLLPIIFAIIAIDLAISYFSTKLMQKLGLVVRVDYLKQIFHFELSLFKKIPVGDFLYTIFNDTANINEAISIRPMNLIINVLLLLIFMGVLFYMNIFLALVAVLALPLQLLFFMVFRKRLFKAIEQVKRKDQYITGLVEEKLLNIQEIKINVMEIQELKNCETELKDRLKLDFNRMLIEKVSGSVLGFVLTFWGLALLILGGVKVYQGALTIGQLMAFLALATRMFQPSMSIINILLGYQDIFVRLQRFYHFYGQPSELRELSPPEKIQALELVSHVEKIAPLSLKFEQVGFSYNDHTILTGVDYSFQEGKIYGITGPSGCGKTSFVSLIPRFIEPIEGRISLNTINIRDLPLIELRKRIAYVPSKPFVFTGTILQNIAYGNRDLKVDSGFMREICEIARILDFIDKVPGKFEGSIFPYGGNISMGEMQRIALARALFKQPRILILDEAFTGVEEPLEQKIIAGLHRIKTSMIIILISHRQSSLFPLDVVIELKNGKLLSSSRTSPFS